MKFIITLLLFLNINNVVFAKKYYQDFSLHKEIKFLEKFYKVEIDYPILIINLIPNRVKGTCLRKQNKVVLNRRNILQNTFTGKVILIAHELAHCMLKKDHDSSRYDKNNCPKSIMSPFIPNNMDKCVRILGMKYYLNQLDFSKLKNKKRK